MDHLVTDERGVATRTGLSVRTIQKLRLQGGGPIFLKLGRAVRYRVLDVERWLDDRQRTSTSDPGVAKR